MLPCYLFDRLLSAVLLLLIATGTLEAQSIRENPDLTPELKALLRTSPALVAASLLYQLGRLPHNPKSALRFDETHQRLTYKGADGNQNEFLCDRLEDGYRRSYPGTQRHEISLQCVLRTFAPKASPKLSKWNVLIEQEGDHVSAEFSYEDKRVFAGTMLPAHLPHWAPDLSSVDGKVVELIGSQMGARGAYEIRITVTSRLSPDAFLKALNLKGDVRQSEKDIVVDRRFENETYSTAILEWRSSNGEYIYYLNLRGGPLDADSNRPFGPTSTRKKP